jgi:conjugal transfer mating pair stabilization protein TraN
MSCPAPVSGGELQNIVATRSIATNRDESRCASLASDTSCRQAIEVCTDNDPLTRIINGAAVTQPCWAWERQFTCAQYVEAQDCQTLETTPGCALVGEECLSGEPCRTWERVYDCPVPDQPGSPNQFICDADVYCIDGSCETIAREANDEFKDAVVALNAMDQARREFDPDNLNLFKGTRNTCSSKVFGVLNCCKGKGFPLVPGIQLLVSLGCSREEMLLHERDAQGLCAYVGTYCSDSFLGVCVTKKKAYCCFESKLSRILQEQGRKQLNKPWAKPKTEQCRGFTLEEFSRLDLSQMDFSEVYAEFTEAARLPDELAVASDLQQKIEDYYANTTR